MHSTERTRFVLGLMCIVLGILPLLIALGLIPVDEADVLAGVLCLVFGVVGTWVSLFSPSEGFSGGIPLLSTADNVTLGRWVFGGGALICFAISAYAFRRGILSSRARHKNAAG